MYEAKPQTVKGTDDRESKPAANLTERSVSLPLAILIYAHTIILNWLY